MSCDRSCELSLIVWYQVIIDHRVHIDAKRQWSALTQPASGGHDRRRVEPAAHQCRRAIYPYPIANGHLEELLEMIDIIGQSAIVDVATLCKAPVSPNNRLRVFPVIVKTCAGGRRRMSAKVVDVGS